MEEFSQLLLKLYRSARELPLAEFQDAAIHLIQPIFHFDSALWGTGETRPDGLVINTVHMFNQPPEMLENYEIAKDEDFLAFDIFSHPGHTDNFSTADPKVHERKELRHHCLLYGMRNTLATAIFDPSIQLSNGFAFYRSKSDQQYTEEERRLMQLLVPHLTEALTINRMKLIDHYNESGRRAVAIVDRKGIVYGSDTRFNDLLLSEWPGWRGPQLPSHLRSSVAAQRAYVGHSVRILAEKVEDMLLLCGREISPLDRLSQREREVAGLFAKGLTYKEIAKALGVSPATVRTQIQVIYKKTGISDKGELASLLAESN